MRVTLSTHTVRLDCEPGDPKYYGRGWAPTHRLLYHARNALRAQGLDVIKRRLSADGHLMGDDETPYLRDRGWAYAILDERWAVRDLAEDWNRLGTVTLTLQRWEDAPTPPPHRPVRTVRTPSTPVPVPVPRARVRGRGVS